MFSPISAIGPRCDRSCGASALRSISPSSFCRRSEAICRFRFGFNFAIASSLRKQGPRTAGRRSATRRSNKNTDATRSLDRTLYGSLPSQGRRKVEQRGAAFFLEKCPVCDIVQSRLSHFDSATRQLVDLAVTTETSHDNRSAPAAAGRRNDSAVGSIPQIWSRLSLLVFHPDRPKTRQIRRSGSAVGSLNWRRIASFPLPPTTGSFLAPFCASRKVSGSLSISTTIRYARAVALAWTDACRRMWTAHPRRARRLFRRMACAA